MVFTAPWEREPAGFDCRPLAPRLSVPTLLVSGEVNLYTGRQVVRVLDVLDGDPAGGRADHALALVPGLRSLDAARAATALPPPDPEVASWIAQVCPQPPSAAPSGDRGRVDAVDDASRAASNSASLCWALSPSVSAREKLAITPWLRASRALASSRV